MLRKTRMTAKCCQHRAVVGREWFDTLSNNTAFPLRLSRCKETEMEATVERELRETLLRGMLRSELEADGRDYKAIAKRIRRTMTVPVNDVDDLIDEGFILMFDKEGNQITRDDLVNDGEAPAGGWIISLEAVLLLHIYESQWFGQWQRMRARRN